MANGRGERKQMAASSVLPGHDLVSESCPASPQADRKIGRQEEERGGEEEGRRVQREVYFRCVCMCQ